MGRTAGRVGCRSGTTDGLRRNGMARVRDRARGVGAALTGLLFVAVSINIGRILAQPTLPIRAGETLIILVAQLLVALLLLVPGQSSTALGAEVLVLALLLAGVFLRTRVRAQRDRRPEDPRNGRTCRR